MHMQCFFNGAKSFYFERCGNMATHGWAESGRSPCGWTLPGPSRWQRPHGPHTSCWAPVPSAPLSLDRDGGDRLACDLCKLLPLMPVFFCCFFISFLLPHLKALSVTIYWRASVLQVHLTSHHLLIFVFLLLSTCYLTIFMCDVDVLDVFLFILKCLKGASNIKKVSASPSTVDKSKCNED